MKRALAAAALAILTGQVVDAEETPASSRVRSVGLFKNGLGVVRRTVTLPKAGTYALREALEPVHGTFWVESQAKVEVRSTSREVKVPLAADPMGDFQRALAGRTVTIHFKGTIPPVTGVVESLQQVRPWSRQRAAPGHRWRAAPVSGRAKYLLVRTGAGHTYVDASLIAHLAVTDGKLGSLRRRRPVLLLSVDRACEVSITYLTRGVAWAPSYRLRLGKGTLRIAQKAVVRNELEDLKGAELQLISGFPGVKLAHVTSPLAIQTSWARFFGELSQRVGAARGSRVLTQQVVTNAVAPARGYDLSAIPMGKGADVHYQSIGPRTLSAGDVLALTVGTADAKYERIVQWLVPDTRNAQGRRVQGWRRQQDPDKYRDSVWDAVRFKNPFPFPMTTAPATIETEGRFSGQSLSGWVNAGEQTTLQITKALSVRTRAVEREERGKRQIVYVGGNDYRKMKVKGELFANNHRREAVTLVVRRRFSGELVEASDTPKVALREEGVYSVNRRNELIWTVTLAPGAEVRLTYRYSVLVDN